MQCGRQTRAVIPGLDSEERKSVTMASDVAIVTAAAATDVRDRLDVILRNSL
jgi:hypothetical protein